jgi:hypothetical protein
MVLETCLKMQRNSQVQRLETFSGTNNIVVFQSFGAQLTSTLYLDVRKTTPFGPLTSFPECGIHATPSQIHTAQDNKFVA